MTAHASQATVDGDDTTRSLEIFVSLPPEYFELAFGQELRDEGPHDPASRDEPVVLATPAGELRVRGRIDRVDRVATAVRLGRRTLHIARQSVLWGIGLSTAADGMTIVSINVVLPA